MKNYNKILEAVNRGIKFALDDFEDNELQGQTNSKVKYKGGTKEWLDLMNEVVDLGLPSGTLWCKYNLGVNQNQLFNAKDWYGDYYAWGELKANKAKKNKIYFDWDNYKFGKKYNKLTKYCNNPKYSLNGQFFDNLMELLPEDDVVCKKMKLHNFKFHIPTKEQCEELKNCTINYWVNNYNPNNIEHHTNDDGIKGLNGRVFIGKNGNQLFIPAVGFCSGDYITDMGFYCYLWSSSLYLDNSNCAYYLLFDSEFIRMDGSYRCNGLVIRPVINL